MNKRRYVFWIQVLASVNFIASIMYLLLSLRDAGPASVSDLPVWLRSGHRDMVIFIALAFPVVQLLVSVGGCVGLMLVTRRVKDLGWRFLLANQILFGLAIFLSLINIIIFGFWMIYWGSMG